VVAIAELTNVPAEFIVGQAAAPAFGATAIEDVLVRVDDGVDPEVVRERIKETLGDQARFIVVTSDEYRADTRAQVGGGINAFFLLLGLAAVVGTFGLANTMAVAVTQRYREIGVLRAIGARRRHIRAMAIVESVTLVAIALVLALPLGLVLSGPLLDTSRAQIGDLTVDYRMPWAVVPVMGVVAALVAVGAAVWPARRAAHIEIDTALRFE
jgi:putative ABC transport system permease protein